MTSNYFIKKFTKIIMIYNLTFFFFFKLLISLIVCSLTHWTLTKNNNCTQQIVISKKKVTKLITVLFFTPINMPHFVFGFEPASKINCVKYSILITFFFFFFCSKLCCNAFTINLYTYFVSMQCNDYISHTNEKWQQRKHNEMLFFFFFYV